LQIEIKYAIAWGTLVITLITPASQSTVKLAFKMIKKAITNKTVTMAYKMAAAQNKEYKKRRAGIVALITKTLSQGNSIHVYTR
jgi:hypothetical protein